MASPRSLHRLCDGDLQWHVSAGQGTIYSYAYCAFKLPPFRSYAHAVAYVDLDEGPRFLTNVVGVDDPGADVHIGQRVQLHWEEHEELSVPLVTAGIEIP